jgi:VWFA-related protein
VTRAKRTALFTFAASVTALVAAAPAVLAQAPAALRTERVSTVRLDDVHAPPSSDRSVDLYLRALTDRGTPVEKLVAKDFAIRQDGKLIDPDDVSVTLLEETKRGVAVVLALDLSPTMREPFEEAKQAALGFLDRLGSHDRVAVLGFAGSVDEVAGFTAARPEVRRAIDALQPKNEPAPTRAFDGIHRAVEMVRTAKDLPRRGIVIVFSDGQDGGSDHTLEEVIELSKGGLGEARVLVYSIGYATGYGDSGLANLKKLAKETGSDYAQADSGTPITRFYGDIWTQLMKSWVVRFPSSLDGKVHDIEVTLDGQAQDSRTGQYAYVSSGLWRALVAAALVLAAIAAGVWFFLLQTGGRVVFQTGPNRGKTVRLRRGKNRIGQIAEGNDIVIPLDTVSRRHAEILVAGRRAELKDLDSTNGTFVNDKPIRTSPLKVGDRIRIADVELLYRR